MYFSLDFDAVLARLAPRADGTILLAAVQEAVNALSLDPLKADCLELGDVLVQLAAQGDGAVAGALADEVAGWARESEGGLESAARGWMSRGRVPNTPGYGEARRWVLEEILGSSSARAYGDGCGGLDERVVEYPWVFDRLNRVHPRGGRMLDAGSTMNHAEILRRLRSRGYGPLSIVTLKPESQAYLSEDIRYEYGDLRQLPYRDAWFDTVLCVSTLEHVGMANAIYGDEAGAAVDARGEAERALAELHRVLVPNGVLLLSVPVGKVSDRGWQRIFGREEIEQLVDDPRWASDSVRVFRSFRDGWREASWAEVEDAGYNDNHPGGIRDAPEWVAAAEAVALIELVRSPSGLAGGGELRDGVGVAADAVHGAEEADQASRIPDSLMSLAAVRLERKDFEGALRCLHPLVGLLNEPASEWGGVEEGLNLLVACYVGLSLLDEAEGVLSRLLAMDPYGSRTRESVRAVALRRARRLEARSC